MIRGMGECETDHYGNILQSVSFILFVLNFRFRNHHLKSTEKWSRIVKHLHNLKTGDRLVNALFHEVLAADIIPVSWIELVVIPIFEKGSRNACGNHQRISLTAVVTKPIMIDLLVVARCATEREEQPGFRTGRNFIDQISSLRRVMAQCQVYRRPTAATSLDLKIVVDFVDRNVIFAAYERRQCLQNVNILNAL